MNMHTTIATEAIAIQRTVAQNFDMMIVEVFTGSVNVRYPSSVKRFL